MPKMMLFITEKVSVGLRGELTRWLLQLKPGVFIGTISTRVGERLWERIQKNVGKGSAIWIKSTNNEQRFKIICCGNPHWDISDFDGIQLITHPHKPIQKRKIGSKKQDNSLEPPKILWDTEGTPPNFIIRKVKFTHQNTLIKSSFSGASAYVEYPPKRVWEKPWLDDIDTIGKSLLSFVLKLKNLIKQSFWGKKLVSLDIETTDYLPKAYEGYINIIGISILDLSLNDINKISLNLFQIFNMTRKKQNIPYFLELIEPYLKSADELLVFNQDFDISILNHVINEFKSNLVLPQNIIDLKKWFSSLLSLETFLTAETGVKRMTTEKGIFSEYYQLFKGIGKAGKKKQIEPIGTYNLTDCITPLFVYLILCSKNSKLLEHKNYFEKGENKIEK